MRVEVKRELLLWAHDRSGLDLDALVHRFPKFTEWESGEMRPRSRCVGAYGRPGPVTTKLPAQPATL